ncbi:hypothetical protein Tcan_00506, partial [Toxocara canis]
LGLLGGELLAALCENRCVVGNHSFYNSHQKLETGRVERQCKMTWPACSDRPINRFDHSFESLAYGKQIFILFLSNACLQIAKLVFFSYNHDTFPKNLSFEGFFLQQNQHMLTVQ